MSFSDYPSYPVLGFYLGDLLHALPLEVDRKSQSMKEIIENGDSERKYAIEVGN